MNIPVPSTTEGVYLNVVRGIFGTSAATAPDGWDINVGGVSTLTLTSPAAPSGGVYVGTGSFFNQVPPGMLVGPFSTFASSPVCTPNPASPLNLNSSNNVFGFRFLHEGTGQIHYGWFRMSIANGAAAQPRTMVEYVYESIPGQAVGFPSPGTGVAGCLGAAMTLRRRR